MNYDNILKFALPPLITFLVGVFLPETLRLDLRSILTYVLFDKWRFERYLGHQRAIKGPKFAFCGFFQVDAEGRLLTSGPGISLTREIIEEIARLMNESSTIKDYSKIWPVFALRVEDVDLPKYALYLKRLKNIKSYLYQKDGVTETFPLCIWGTLDGKKIQQLSFEIKEGVFYPRAQKDFVKIGQLASKVCAVLPGHQFPRYLASILVGLYQQSPVSFLGIHERKFTEAHLLLDDGFSTLRSGINLVRDVSGQDDLVDEHSHFFLPEYHGLKAYLYEQDGSMENAIIEYTQALESNLYHPYENEGEFKRAYLRNYALDLAKKAAEGANEEPSKESPFDHALLLSSLILHDNSYSVPMLHSLLALILKLSEDEYWEAIKVFERLTRKYPDSSIPWIYWGEALKLYKSEPFNPNPANLNLTLEKYKVAEQIDPKWEMIKVKIAIVYMFKKAYNQGGDDTEEQLKAYLIKSKGFYDDPELKKFFGQGIFKRTAKE
jgi:tetratricopeptide (TPR) repeat protein